MQGHTRRVPPEYIEYELLEHFHCLPSQLDTEDHNRLMQFLWIKGIVTEARNDVARREK